LIDPAAFSKAPLFGPHMHNFVEISQRLLAADGATRINSSGELAHQVQQQLLDLPRTREQGTRALNEVKQHRGAPSRLLAIVDEQLQETTEIR
ncbi:MAG: 3-deoxy-D-manno-octulosonic acid transferase, partial [Gammaproteobacteria bacterium]